jgi:hypothetical protein
VDGNGVDDDCQEVAPVALPDAAAAALIAVDLDGDGAVSTSEAAQSDRTGGTNCNHGGYVSGVAHGSGDCADAGAPAGANDEGSGDGEDAADDPGEANDAATLTTTAVTPTCPTETETESTETASTVCAPPVAPAPVLDAPVDTSPSAHGKAVSEVAQSDAVGGKNCNHGGAVSAAAKKDHSGPHGNATKGNHAKAHGKGHGKGHGKP